MENIKRTSSDFNRMTAFAFKKNAKVPVNVMLNNIRSGHNIGSVFRTADAFNVKKIYLSGISAIPPNKEIHKTALGSTESVEWEYINNPAQFIIDQQLKGEKVYAVEQTKSAISLENFTLMRGSIATFIFGNEVDGVDQELINLCDATIEIPQFGTKHSLNIAVSAGIVLWQLIRDNQLKGY